MLSAPGSSSFQAFLGPAMAEHNLRIEREALSELLPWRGFFRCRWITVPDNEAALYGSERYSYLTIHSPGNWLAELGIAGIAVGRSALASTTTLRIVNTWLVAC
jgi:hypothetical protein